MAFQRQRYFLSDPRCANLLVSRVFEALGEASKSFDSVAAYLPIGLELDLRSHLPQDTWYPAVRSGRQLAWFQNATRPDLTRSPLGLLQAPAKACVTSPPGRVLCFVPALGADQHGYRLGYGGGYFDTFLRSIAHRCFAVACLPSVSLVPLLPREAHDIPMDLIVTERHILFL